MKLHRVAEDNGDFSVVALFDILVGAIKDYIPADKSKLDSIRNSWLDTVESGEDQSEQSIPIKIPEKFDAIDFGINKDTWCVIPSGYEVKGYIYLYNVYEDSCVVSLVMPKISTLLDFFCGTDRILGDDYLLEEEVDTLDKARNYANKLKNLLDTYTSNIKFVSDSLSKMESISYNIYDILKKEGAFDN